MRTLNATKRFTISGIAGILVSVMSLNAFMGIASAATPSRTLVRFDRMAVSTATTGTVCLNPTTTATEASVQVTFPTGYTVSTTTGNWTVSTTNLAWPATATAWPGIGTATAAAGQVVTFPSTDLTVGTLYCFNWTNSAAVSVKAGATASNSGTIATRDSVPATIDSGSFATASIADDTITVTATVPQSFSFALSGNTDPLGTLASGSVTPSTTPRTATVNTNAKNGWTVWAKGANTGLTSATAASTIPATTPGTSSTLTAGTPGYNTGVTQTQTSGTGTITVATPFAGAAFTGGGLDTTLRSLATSNGTANNAGTYSDKQRSNRNYNSSCN